MNKPLFRNRYTGQRFAPPVEANCTRNEGLQHTRQGAKNGLLIGGVAAAMVFGLTGCGGNASGNGNPAGSSNLAAPATTLADGAITADNGTEPSRMIGNDRRKAVIYECWYALRQNYSSPNDTGPTGGQQIWDSKCVSNWNYIGNDPNAFSQVQSIVGAGNASVATNPSFSTGDAYGKKGGYGRGGQCTYFSSLILFRALGGFRFSTDTSHGYFRWSDLDTNRYKYSAADAQPGDLVFTKKGTPHIGVCVRNLGNGKIDVVDSNYLGYGNSSYIISPGQGSSEIIGCHEVDARASDYRVITGDAKKHTELTHRRWYNL